ncbi:MAG: hypothetical protein AAGA93_03545 [Actinomycetota bacterium]
MATAIVTTPLPAAAAESTATAEANRPLAAFLATAAVCIALVWAAVATLLIVVTGIPPAAAIGVGGYAAFWLGGGFGAIFGGAAAFGRDH